MKNDTCSVDDLSQGGFGPATKFKFQAGYGVLDWVEPTPIFRYTLNQILPKSTEDFS
jgi:hypothetical protein